MRAAIDQALTVNPAIGERPLFPGLQAKIGDEWPKIAEAWSRYHARQLLERAEAKAELPNFGGSDFLAYRWKWATERSVFPHKTSRPWAPGGISVHCRTEYEQADETTLLAESAC